MKKEDISSYRKISQVFFFLLLVYGGFLYLPQINSDLVPFTEVNPNVTKLPSLAAPQKYTEVLDTYTPFRSCRYMDGNRIFRACSMHYFTEVPAYGVPLTNFIPHFLIFLALSILFARFFCGWICPLGAISDFLNYFRKLLGFEKTKLPDKFFKHLKTAKAVWIALLFILAVAIAIPFIGLKSLESELFLVACQTCPARTIFPTISGHLPGGFPFSNPLSIFFSILGILFLLSIFLGFFGKRIWCRFCPNGLVLSWFNKGSFVVKEKNTQKCTRCGICKRVCPMDNEHVYNEKLKKNINHKDCINCFSCVEKCPEKDCLKVKFVGKKIFSS